MLCYARWCEYQILPVGHHLLVNLPPARLRTRSRHSKLGDPAGKLHYALLVKQRRLSLPDLPPFQCLRTGPHTARAMSQVTLGDTLQLPCRETPSSTVILCPTAAVRPFKTYYER